MSAGNGGDRFRELEQAYGEYTVYDRHYEKIGKVDDLFVDENDQPEYIGVKTGLLVAVVVGVGAAVRTACGPEPVVGTHLVLVLGGYLVVVVKVRPVLHRALGLVDRQALALLVGRDEVHGDEGAAGAEEAHFDADVLGLVVLVDEQVVYLADLVAVAVVDGVPLVLVFDRREPIAALLHRCDLLA